MASGSSVNAYAVRRDTDKADASDCRDSAAVFECSTPRVPFKTSTVMLHKA